MIKREELNGKHKQTCAQAIKQTHVIKLLSADLKPDLFVAYIFTIHSIEMGFVTLSRDLSAPA